jgi:hypothetical protein
MGSDVGLAAGLLSLTSLVLASLAAALLSSYFASILPTKRNLLTHLDWLLVIAMAANVNSNVCISRRTVYVLFNFHPQCTMGSFSNE